MRRAMCKALESNHSDVVPMASASPSAHARLLRSIQMLLHGGTAAPCPVIAAEELCLVDPSCRRCSSRLHHRRRRPRRLLSR